ncbi:MAG: DsrE family protein [Rhodospirillaceae bacterium]
MAELPGRSIIGRRTVLGVGLAGSAAAALGARSEKAAAQPVVPPVPTPDAPRLVVLQLSDPDARAVNNLLFNIVNIQKHYGLDSVKVSVIAYGDGVRALLRETTPALDRVKSLMAYGVEFVACGSTLEATKRPQTDLIEGVSVVPAAMPELIERQLRGWVVIHP